MRVDSDLGDSKKNMKEGSLTHVTIYTRQYYSQHRPAFFPITLTTVNTCRDKT